MLELRNITLKRDHTVLEDLEVQFFEGKIYGIIGKSGAGKTSLLKIAAGLLDATEGQVYFDGKRLPGPSEKLIPGHEDIQLVNQDFALDPYHTVEENVRVKILVRKRAVQDEIVNDVLGLVELDHLRKRKALDLSGGEQQRLALARALACEPRVLLLDEPFVHLDQRLRWKIQTYLRAVNRNLNTILVLVSHDGAEIMGFAEEVFHLKAAKVARRCSAEEMYFFPTDMEEGELMGPINQLHLDGHILHFRPNEYLVVKEGIVVHVQLQWNTGQFWLNQALDKSGTEILLQSEVPLPKECTIEIRKKK